MTFLLSIITSFSELSISLPCKCTPQSDYIIYVALVTLAFFQLIQLNDTDWFIVDIPFAVIHCGLSAGLNVLMTLTIVSRMIYLRQNVIDVLGAEHAKLYTSVAAMFVESGAIYSILTFICSLHVSRVLGKEFQSVVFLALVQTTVCSASLCLFGCGRTA